MIKTICELCAVCSSRTSLDFGPAGVETTTADVSVGLEAHGQQVAGAGDLHGGGGGGAKLGQLRSCEVRAAVDLRGKQQERIQQSFTDGNWIESKSLSGGWLTSSTS